MRYIETRSLGAAPFRNRALPGVFLVLLLFSCGCGGEEPSTPEVDSTEVKSSTYPDGAWIYSERSLHSYDSRASIGKLVDELDNVEPQFSAAKWIVSEHEILAIRTWSYSSVEEVRKRTPVRQTMPLSDDTEHHNGLTLQGLRNLVASPIGSRHACVVEPDLPFLGVIQSDLRDPVRIVLEYMGPTIHKLPNGGAIDCFSIAGFYAVADSSEQDNESAEYSLDSDYLRFKSERDSELMLLLDADLRTVSATSLGRAASEVATAPDQYWQKEASSRHISSIQVVDIVNAPD